MKRIDIEHAARIHTLLSLCRRRGVDPVKTMDEGRLLRHPGTAAEDAVQLMDHVINVVRNAPLTGEVKTPLDARNTIVGWLEMIKNAYAEKQ